MSAEKPKNRETGFWWECPNCHMPNIGNPGEKTAKCTSCGADVYFKDEEGENDQSNR